MWKGEGTCGWPEVLESLTPAQQVIKIVDEELVELMGRNGFKINISFRPPTIIMMVGLQVRERPLRAENWPTH